MQQRVNDLLKVVDVLLLDEISMVDIGLWDVSIGMVRKHAALNPADRRCVPRLEAMLHACSHDPFPQLIAFGPITQVKLLAQPNTIQGGKGMSKRQQLQLRSPWSVQLLA